MSRAATVVPTGDRRRPPPPPRWSGELGQIITMVRWLLYMVLAVVAWVVASYVASVIGPVLVAFGVAYLTSPVLDWLTGRGLSRGVGALVLMLLLLGSVVGLSLFVVPRAAHQFTVFADKVPQLVVSGTAWVEHTFDVEVPASWRDALSGRHLDGVMGGAGPLSQIAAAAVSGVFSAVGVVVEVLLVLIFTFYFLVDFPHMQDRVVELIPPRHRGAALDLLREIDQVVAGWVRGQALVMAILATLYAIGFSIAGMTLAIPIGLTVGILIVIPFIGALIGAGLAIGICLADGAGAPVLVGVGVVLVVLHVLEAGVLTPKIVGHKVGLSESAALLAVFAGGKVLGFVGVLLAVPIAATIAVLLRHGIRAYERTEFYGEETDAEVPVTEAMTVIAPAPIEEPHPAVPVVDATPDGTGDGKAG